MKMPLLAKSGYVLSCDRGLTPPSPSGVVCSLGKRHERPSKRRPSKSASFLTNRPGGKAHSVAQVRPSLAPSLVDSAPILVDVGRNLSNIDVGSCSARCGLRLDRTRQNLERSRSTPARLGRIVLESAQSRLTLDPFRPMLAPVRPIWDRFRPISAWSRSTSDSFRLKSVSLRRNWVRCSPKSGHTGTLIEKHRVHAQPSGNSRVSACDLPSSASS